MYDLLIVDDEPIAVRAIERGIDWSDLEIGRIHTAGDYEDAIEILDNHPIRILITDIEMPGPNGIRLLEYVNNRHPRIRAIVTTGHSQFEYIQKALQYRTLDYLLKPLDFGQLKSIVERAIRELNHERDVESLHRRYEESQLQWQRNLPILEDRFWQDVLNHRIRLTPDNIRSTIESYRIRLRPDLTILPVLISIEMWHGSFSASEEEALEYALRKAAEELILRDDLEGRSVHDRNGVNVLLIYLVEGEEPITRQQLTERCRTFIETCGDMFYCSVSCYIGDPCPTELVPYRFRQLLRAERNNVTEMRTVIRAASSRERDCPAEIRLPAFEDWQTMLETGRKAEFMHAHDEWFHSLADSGSATPETLRAFCIGFMNMIIQVSSVHGIPLSELPVFGDDNDLYAHCRSIQTLSLWSARLTEELFARCHELGRPSLRSPAIETTLAHINQNLDEDLSLESISQLVHLNPAYLSRLFKKEMGVSMSEYIIQARIARAKEMLRSPDVKISSIAASVGYTHFSHFAKMFRRIVGMPPHEYRKRFLPR